MLFVGPKLTQMNLCARRDLMAGSFRLFPLPQYHLVRLVSLFARIPFLTLLSNTTCVCVHSLHGT